MPLTRLGNVTPNTRAIAQEVVTAANLAGYPLRVLWGMGPGTEHGSGRALDFMVAHAGAIITNPQAAGDFIADYLWANRDRLGLIHIIWRQRIKSTDPRFQPGVWVWMEDRGTPTENHYDHVHAYFVGTYTPALPAPSPNPARTINELAAEVLAGQWGNGDDRRARLTAAGYNYDAVQRRVNELVAPTSAAPKLPPFQLPRDHYYGLITGPERSHGGYYPAERPIIRIIQQRLIAKGYVPGITDPNSPWADGLFEQPTADAVARFQRAEMPGTTFFGQVWWDDYAQLAKN